jgi:hypothetical protein
MNAVNPISGQRRGLPACTGSVLIYVLWILTVISVLAFQLSADSTATALNQSAFANQLKKQMQIESAIQFAIFKINSNQWENRSFEFDLNNQQIRLRIFNEAGFVSLYEPDSPALDNILKSVELDEDSVTELKQAIGDEDRALRLNSFSELTRFSGLDLDELAQLIPLVSIFHSGSVNPMQAPPEVLMQFHRVDQFRVGQLRDTSDPEEIEKLRNELVSSMRQQDSELSEELSSYFRLHVEIDGMLHRVFINKGRRQQDFTVVLIENRGLSPDANAS